jgi:hypothetical protein
MEKITYGLMADGMALIRQFLCEDPKALDRPSERRLRVTARRWLDQCLQSASKSGILLGLRLATATTATCPLATIGQH